MIVPVYRGLAETVACLESVLRWPQKTPFELIAIDDSSPEPEVSERLRAFARAGRLTLLRNDENLGFVKTVNRGMSLHPQRDVVLLNSDAEVANDWLDRIRRCAYRERAIGTVTPFSNNATICSYPRTCYPNALPHGLDLATIDRFFARTNAGHSVEIPTAVGFCMFIKRACLDEVGLFDAARFGKGYGEENDFCLRALERGWRHVLCADAFVLHEGGVSFGPERVEMQARALERIRELHPHYMAAVGEFIERDPARTARIAVDIARIQASAGPLHLVVGDREPSRERRELVLRRGATGHAELAFASKDEGFRLYFELPRQYATLVNVLRSLGVGSVSVEERLVPILRLLPRDLGSSQRAVYSPREIARFAWPRTRKARKLAGEAVAKILQNPVGATLARAVPATVKSRIARGLGL